MLQGKIIHWERYEWKVALSGTPSAPPYATMFYEISGGMGAKEAIVSMGRPVLIDGMQLSVRSYLDAGLPKHSYRFVIAGVYDVSVINSGWRGNFDTHIEIDNLRVYTLKPFGFRLMWDTLRWYIEGSLYTTLGPLSLDNTFFDPVVPASVPQIGVPPRIGALANLGYDMVYGGYLTGNTHESAFATVTGGWRFRYGSGQPYVTPPVTLRLHDPGTSCAKAPIALSATNTYNASVAARHELDVTTAAEGTCQEWICPDGQVALVPATFNVMHSQGTYDYQNGSILLIPDLPKRVMKLNPDYASLIARGGFPQTKASATIACFEQEDADVIGNSSTNSEEIYHPRKETLLSTVLNDTHLIEDVFAHQTYAPYGWHSRHAESDRYTLTIASPGACPDPEEGET